MIPKLIRLPSTVWNRKSVFLTLLSSYLLIFLLPVTIGVVLYSKVEGMMVEHAERANTALLDQLRQTLDVRLREVEHASQRITLNPKLQGLLNSDGSEAPEDAYKMVEFMKDHLAQDRGRGTLISDAYLYFGRSDTILSSTARTDSRTFFDRIYPVEGMSYEDWTRQVLESYHYRSYLPARRISSSDVGSRSVLTYVQSLPLVETKDIKGALVLLLDAAPVRAMLSQAAAGGGRVFIVSEGGELVLSSKEGEAPGGALLERLGGTAGRFEQTDESGREHIVTYARSEQTTWRYVLVLPKDLVLQSLQTLKAWALGLLLLCLLGGGLAAYRMAYRNSSPIRELARFIRSSRGAGGTPGEPRDDELGEFELIRETIEVSREEERRLRDTVAGQTPVLRANFLQRLLRGEVDPEAVTPESLRFMQMRFVSDLFAVLYVRIGDIREFGGDASERQWALVRFIVTNVCRDLLAGAHHGYTVELDRTTMGVIVNFRREEVREGMGAGAGQEGSGPQRDGGEGAGPVSGFSSASLEDDLLEAAVTLQHVMRSRFKVPLTLGISRIHEGLGRIGECALEAARAADHRIVSGAETVIRFADLQGEAHHYHYPIELEVQLMGAVKSGDAEGVHRLLQSIYALHFGSRRITPEMGRCLFFNMVSTLLKILNGMSLQPADIFPGDFDPFRKLSQCETAEEMHAEISGLFLTLCRYMKARSSDHSQLLLQAIRDHIEERYGDGGLSLTSMADTFHITPQYLSAFFKKQQGENLTDYVAKVRVGHAQRLLRDKRLTVTQIAHQVGYAADIGLIRVFKKVTGTTPGKYRETMEEEGAVPQDHRTGSK
ncbi:AraC family transcriptional regulator [Paenibacillus mucilaginosus]|uniref:Transcriptional regulator, AraC family n=1 Tax=Paenibacillus mucilaginosus (strain KNP414) TaxID=1036673 RepID=F8F938_PAEMK|nr:helix-turn-helix domain-containing protein [Paenibacillus mucilaginosus]AEI42486.1 transcriptional regulator, AraC family [Paenibacillus mucilaginosus KNP414]MCG7213880.1 helix-turn-helix domain-containing protein [Paenibacillus mucilaginosus]WDM25886.1 helix-turn-helix domain-containing protein [Paenibacillus mucilaginosus]